MPHRPCHDEHPFAELQRQLNLSDREIQRRGGPNPRTLRRIRAGLSIREDSLRKLSRVTGQSVEVLRQFIAAEVAAP